MCTFAPSWVYRHGTASLLLSLGAGGSAAGECGLVWASGHCSADCASSPRPACLCQLVMVADSRLSSQSPPASEPPKAFAAHGDLPPRQRPSCDCCRVMRVRVWHLLVASSAGGVGVAVVNGRGSRLEGVPYRSPLAEWCVGPAVPCTLSLTFRLTLSG